MEVKKGMAFIYDALIASTLLLSLAGLIYYLERGNNNELYNYYNYKIPQDVINILNNYKLSDYNTSLQNTIKQELNITDNKERNALELLVLAFVYNKSNTIEDILSPFNLSKENIAIYIDNSLVYNTSPIKYNNHMTSAVIPVSGYEENKNPFGYTARAYAKKIIKNNTIVIPIYVLGSGNKGGELTQTKWFYLENNTYLNATLYFAIHYGGSSSDLESISVNGNNLKDQVVWLWRDTGSNIGAFGAIYNIQNYLHPGWNSYNITFYNLYFHSHTHPGGRIEITTSSSSFYKPQNYYNKTFFFDKVYSKEKTSWWWGYGTGAWESFDFYVPLNANVNNATLYLNLKHIDDSGGWVYDNGWYYEDRDIIVIVNGNTIYGNNHASGDYYLSFNLSQYLHTGTNYVLVYGNCYGNYFFGSDDTILYSDPKNDPEHSSRVFINYTLNDQNLYGYIDFSRTYNIGGDIDNPKYSTLFQNTSAEVKESFIHIAQTYSYDVSVKFRNDSSSPYETIYQSQGARDVPSSIFMEGYRWNTKGNNYFLFEDSCSGCDFLPWTMIDVHYLIPSFVPYGSVFDTKEEAEEDAVNRLKALIGNDLDLVDIANDTITSGNIPWMYGPTLVEVKSWK